MAAPKRRRKGVFSDLQLPVAKQYVRLAPRNALLAVGAVGALVIVALFGFDVVALDGSSVSNGPLSANHAILQSDCSACHTAFETVTDAKCGVCHEKFGDDLGVYSYASHYLYRTKDFTRLVTRAGEERCFTCHPEHQGRDAAIARVPDAECTACHDIGSFENGHPEFEFAADDIPDPARLRFPHTRHVNEVLKREELADVEQACLYCHEAGDDGRGFEPISFDRACAACHIAAGTATDWLPVGRRGSSDPPGVLTLEAIRASGAPGTRWSDFMNPDEFQARGDQVRKRQIYHEDPWILENLRRIRSILYPEDELAALLRLSGEVDPDDARVLYEEALSTLRGQAEELRGVPDREVQRELGEIDRLITQIESRLREPFAPLDETRFMVAHEPRNTALDPAAVAAYEGISATLAAPCTTCHTAEGPSLGRVQTDQRTLVRAEFSHRAHVTQRGCLDCHGSIPIREYAARDSSAAPELDHAAIQNLPTIDTCRSCHAPAKASDTCVTCHVFHADKSQHVNMLRYLE